MAIISVGTFKPLWVDAPPENTETAGLVTEILTELGQSASQSQQIALQAINQLAAFAPVLPSVDVPGIPIQEVSALPIGTAPTEPDMTSSYPSPPTDPVIGSLVGFTLGDEPVFDVSAPLLMDIPLPDPLAVSPPTAPAIAEVSVPVSPDYVLPDVPTMLGLNLPNAPTLNLPQFFDVMGDKPEAPDASFAWSEVAYATALLTQAQSGLLTLIQGKSTGLDPAVEAAIWNRGRDRQALITERGVAEANRIVASKGFSMPQGTLLRMVQQALQEGMRLDADLSRDIMIKQAELEQSNFQFAYGLAVQLEGRLMEHFNQVQNRSLDALKFQFQSVIAIFNARVSLYQADAQVFAIKAQVFKTRLEAELAQLEIYKSELEGQKLIGELNQQAVAIYEARLKAVGVVADIFRAQIEGVKVRIEAETNKVAMFKAQADAFDSMVKAKNSEYLGYSEQVKAQLSRVQMFGEEVGAFKSRTDAFSALVQARLGAATLDFKQTQEFPLELFKSRLQAYQTEVQAEGDRVKSLAQVFLARVQAFAEGERAKSAFTGAEVEAVKATTAIYTSQAQLALQNGEMKLKAAVSSAETVQTSIRAAGQIAGQMTAAALAARNASASLSASSGFSNSNSASNSASSSDNFSMSVSETYVHKVD